MISDEDRFIEILALVESTNQERQWGDGGLAVGRYQQHPRFYCDWGPRKDDFGGHERSWDWCFELAARRFFRQARMAKQGVTLAQIGMAYHLHGAIVWTGFDPRYAKLWSTEELAIDAKNRGL